MIPLLLLALAAPPDTLTASDFAKLHSDLVPQALEPWQTVPWKIDLLDARALAVAEGKPLFLWSMNGHPLGCT